MQYKTKFLSFLVILLVISTSYGQSSESTDSSFYRVMLFKWADTLDVSSQTRVLELFKNMPNKIDGFKSIEINEVSKSDDGYDHVLILKFSSNSGLETYEKHPDHLSIKELVPPLVRGFLLYEYWKKND